MKRGELYIQGMGHTLKGCAHKVGEAKTDPGMPRVQSPRRLQDVRNALPWSLGSSLPVWQSVELERNTCPIFWYPHIPPNPVQPDLCPGLLIINTGRLEAVQRLRVALILL